MKFKKEQLEFLNIFQSCINTSSFEGDKLNIVSYKDTSKVYFSLFTDEVKLIKEVDVSDTIDLILSINLTQFFSMLNLCKENSYIEILEDKIKFGENSEYSFENYDFNVDNFKTILETSIDNETITLKELDKINKVSFSLGSDVETSCIAFQDNHFLTYDGLVLSFIETNNNISENFYLPKTFYKILQLFKKDLKEIDLCSVNDFFFYTEFDSIKIFIMKNEYSIPYIFDEDILAKFNHSKKITFNKQESKNALSRLKVLSQQTSYKRVFINIENENIKFEIKDGFKGFENVSAKTDEVLNDFYFICSINHLYNIINTHTDEEITIYLEKDDDLPTIKTDNEKEKVSYVLTLFKKYEEDESYLED
jgi:hypothetical protein